MIHEILPLLILGPAYAIAAITLPGTLELALLTIGAQFFKDRPPTLPASSRPNIRMACIIPAFNEEEAISRTIQSLLGSLNPGDIIVVADNCTDRTAKTARDLGVRVLERQDPAKIGKPYALQYACEVLSREHYDYFVIVDADTLVAENFIPAVIQGFGLGMNAIQTRYEVLFPKMSMRHRLMDLAFLSVNFVRPLGRNRLGLSCGILGNGFGIHKAVWQKIPFPLDSVVEDVSYHIALVRQGIKVHFLPETSVYGEIPDNIKGAVTQRVRWEGGRWKTAIQSLPGLAAGIFQGHFSLIEPLLDLLLLPLAYHCLLLLIAAAISPPWLQLYAFGALGIVGYHLLVCLYLGRRSWKEVFTLMWVPFYMIWKIGILMITLVFLIKGLEWRRTERCSSEKNPPRK